MNNHHRNLISAVLASASVIALSTVAIAQPAADADKAKGDVEKVTVTAQKRSQVLKDVPMSVSVVTPRQLENATVTDVFSLTSQVPALVAQSVNPPSAGSSFMIRGLGTSVFNLGFESSVGSFQDGVYRARSGLVAGSDFLDLARIEVLKGPQGTLFGKNTTAGVVHFITNAPTHDNDGMVKVEYNGWDQFTAQLVQNLDVSETFALRAAGYVSTGGGWQEDPGRNDEYADRGRWMIRGQALWEPTENFSIRIIGDYGEADEKTAMPVRLQNTTNPIFPAGPTITFVNQGLAAAAGSCVPNPVNPNGRIVCNNVSPDLSVEDGGISAEMNYDFSDVTLTSLTSYRTYSDVFRGDNDFIGVDLLRTAQTVGVDTFTEELRLAGGSDEKGYHWLIGAYYANEDIDRTNEFIWGTQVGSAAPGLFFGHLPLTRAFLDEFAQSSEGYALFVHGDVDLTDQLRLTAGLRQNWDNKDGSGLFTVPNALGSGPAPDSFPLAVPHNFVASTDDTATTGTVSLSYELTPDMNAYFTYSRGYKSGGISLIRDAAGPFIAFTPGGPIVIPVAQDPTFDPEFANNFELGLKGNVSKGVYVDLSLFNTKFTDYQQQTLTPSGAFDVTNVGSVKSKGAEVLVKAQATDELDLSFALAYVDARFGDDVPPSTSTGVVLADRQLPFSSRWQGNVGATYEALLGDTGWFWFAHADMFFRSKYATDTDLLPGRIQKGYELFNGRLGVRDDKWEVAAFCRNCFDERYVTASFEIPLDGAGLGTFIPGDTSNSVNGFLGEPRFYGLSASVRY